MPGKGGNSGQAFWQKVVTVGLAAVAIATAANSGSHGTSAATSDPARCVIVKLP